MGGQGDIQLAFVTSGEMRVVEAARKMSHGVDGIGGSMKQATQAGREMSESLERGAEAATRKVQQTERAVQQTERAMKRLEAARAISVKGAAPYDPYDPDIYPYAGVQRRGRTHDLNAYARGRMTARMGTAMDALGSQAKAATDARELNALAGLERVKAAQRAEQAEADRAAAMARIARRGQMAQYEANLDLLRGAALLNAPKPQAVTSAAQAERDRLDAMARIAKRGQMRDFQGGLQQISSALAINDQLKLTEGMDRYKRLLNEIHPKTRQWIEGLDSGLQSVTGSLGRMVLGYWAITRAIGTVQTAVRISTDLRDTAAAQNVASARPKQQLAEIADNKQQLDTYLQNTRDIYATGYGDNEGQAAKLEYQLQNSRMGDEDRKRIAELGAYGITENPETLTIAAGRIKASFKDRAGSTGNIIGKIMAAQKWSPATSTAIALMASKAAVSADELDLPEFKLDMGAQTQTLGLKPEELFAALGVTTESLGPEAGIYQRQHIRRLAYHSAKLGGLEGKSYEEMVRIADKHLEGKSAKYKQKFWGNVRAMEYQGKLSGGLNKYEQLMQAQAAAGEHTLPEKIDMIRNTPELYAPVLKKQEDAKLAIAVKDAGTTATLVDAAYATARKRMEEGFKTTGTFGIGRGAIRYTEWLGYQSARYGLIGEDEYIANKGNLKTRLAYWDATGRKGTMPQARPRVSYSGMGSRAERPYDPDEDDPSLFRPYLTPVPAAASQPAASQPATSFDRSVQDFGRIVENLRTVVDDAKGNGPRRTNNTILAGPNGPDDDPQGF